MVVNSVIATGATGKVGVVILQKWKNKTIGRQMPSSVANPETIGQRTQRGKFRYMAGLYSQMATLITVGFVTFRSQITEYNAFIKENIKEFLTNVDSTTLTFDFAKFYISKGSLAPTDTQVTYTTGQASIEFAGTPLPNSNQTDADIPYGVVLSSTGDVLGVNSLGSADRAGGELAINDARILTSGTKHAYVFFASPDYRIVSTSTKATNI